jgi:bifunctional non-homologous end joining protein LigD
MLCIPTRVNTPPRSERWVHEIKLDGFRALVKRQNGSIRVLTKNGADYTHRFPRIVEAVGMLRVKSIILNGEATCFTLGKEDFDKLWDGSTDAILYWIDGQPKSSTQPAMWPSIP